MNKIKRNMLYKTAYNVVATMTPLLTTPYVARVLTTGGVGTFSYTLSIVSYFVLLCMLGITTYGCKEIAKCADDKVKRSERFFEIFSLQLTFTVISLAAYYIYVVNFEYQYLTLFLIQSLRIIACLFDASWLLYGLEEFEITVKRDLFIKVLTIISIFIFVKGEHALIIYTCIMAFTSFLSTAIVVPFAVKRIQFVRIQRKAVLNRIVPILLFFVPTISSGLFHEVDVTILGKYGLLLEAGCYHNADRIINIPKMIVIGLGTVFLSRASRLLNENTEKARYFYIKMDELYTFLVSPIAFGIAGIADDFVPVFLGEGYEGCIRLIYWLSIVLIIRTYNNHLLTGYYLPYGREKAYTFIAGLTTALNVILDIIFIKTFGALGAVWVTIICEGTVYIYLKLKGDRGIVRLSRQDIVNAVSYYAFGVIMFVAIAFSKIFIPFGAITKVAIEILIGFVVYVLLCIVYWQINPHSNVGAEFNVLRDKIAKRF